MIGKYRVMRTLGRGGFAWVYEVQDTTDERPAALKLLDLPPNPEDADEFNERFLREARTIGKLRHRNIVEVRDVGVMADTGRPYMAMELLRGHDLEAELARNGPLEPRRARSLFAGTLDALGVAHAAGVVHKDLKPTNLFIAEPGLPSERMVLIDFGIAWAATDERLTRAGTFTGTPAYAAPEYIRANTVTPALDVYQIGLVLSEALSGVPCVPGSAPVQVILAHLNGEIHIPAALDQTDLGPIVRKATSLDPANRYPDGAAFRQALELATFPATTISAPLPDEFADNPTQAFHVLPTSSKKLQTVDVTRLVVLPPLTVAPPTPVRTDATGADPTGARALAQPNSRRRVLAIAGGLVLAIALMAVALFVAISPRTPVVEVPAHGAPPAPAAVTSPGDAGVVVALAAESDAADAGRPEAGRTVAAAGAAPPAVASGVAVDAGDADATTEVTLGPGVLVTPLTGSVPPAPPDDGIKPLRFGTSGHAERVARRAIERGDWARAIAACKRHGQASSRCAWMLARAHRERRDLASSCYWLAVAGHTTRDCE